MFSVAAAALQICLKTTLIGDDWITRSWTPRFKLPWDFYILPMYRCTSSLDTTLLCPNSTSSILWIQVKKKVNWGQVDLHDEAFSFFSAIRKKLLLLATRIITWYAYSSLKYSLQFAYTMLIRRAQWTCRRIGEVLPGTYFHFLLAFDYWRSSKINFLIYI